MKKIRAFKCDSGHKFDRMVKDSVREVKCHCRANAVRVLSAPKFVGNSCGNNASWR